MDYNKPSLVHEVKLISLASSLYDGIEDNDLSQIKCLLDTKNADPNYIIPDKGISAMHLVAGSQPEDFALEVTRLLLLKKGDPNVRSAEGVTPVHIAAAWGQVALLQLLLASGGNPESCDDEGLAPLDYATREQHTKVIEILQQAYQLQESDTTPQFTLQLEKIVVDEGEFATEYVVDTRLETRSTSTQTDDNSQDTVLQKEKLASLPVTKSDSNESWERVARWCEEQSQLSVRASPVAREHIEAVDDSVYIDVSSDFAGIQAVTDVSAQQDVSHAVTDDSVQILNIQANPDAEITSSSEAFFTCESRRQTVSSQVSSAISEVYKYSDKRYGIVLIEKRMALSSGTSVTEVSESEVEVARFRTPMQASHGHPCKDKGLTGSVSSISTLPSDKGYCTEALRRELCVRGYTPGPITSSTKRVYLRRLAHLRKGQPLPATVSPLAKFSRELEKTLRDLNTINVRGGMLLEQSMAEHFANPPSGRIWREGVAKCSFTYLLLDPRVTLNLPLRATSLSPAQRWATFLRAIFYVGKGKRARPYSHLYQAVDVWNNKTNKRDKKIDHILDIWSQNQGVVCLHVFQNIIPVEAYTREAAMIDALGLENLKNMKRGEYYGVMACKPLEQRRRLGVYLLYRTMHILLHEGERQLQPLDIT